MPAPTGELVDFVVAESPVMEDGLAAMHTDITTYAGRTTGDVPASIRLDVTPMGFHASVRGAGGSWYVDPAYNGIDQGADALYLSYLGADLPAKEQRLVEPESPLGDGQARRAPSTSPGIGEGGGVTAIQRSYRLALVTDNTYATYFSSSADPVVVNTVVTAEKTTLMNRVNQIYGDDFSIRMLLVAETDKANLNTTAAMFAAGGRCGQVACYTTTQVAGGCDSPLLERNRLVLGQLVGAEDYDIGHIGVGINGGGLAGLGVVGTADKAAGCTGIPTPDGDAYAIDYVAHEMGHQFSGNHTFDSTVCNANANGGPTGTAVEPGSGSSVMAYAGICADDDLQPHTDPYFSQRSQTEVAAFTRSTPSTDNEVQNVAVSGFGSGESFTMSFGGATSATIANGTNYTAAGVKAALEAAEPSTATVTVAAYWDGPFTTTGDGFQLTWSGSADIVTPTLTPVAGTFTSIVGTTDNGGADTNAGFANPVPTGNHNPTVTPPVAKTIPRRTPFQLTGSASDPDGEPLLYLWEQNDEGSINGTSLISNIKLTGPLFRVFGTYADVTPAGALQYGSPGENLATAGPTRSFPDIAQVVAGRTNAEASCPTATAGASLPPGAALDCYSEFLPTTARTMSFRLTARDLGGVGDGFDGGTSFADVALTVSPTLGPFLVDSQPTATSVTGATAGTVTWTTGTTSLAPNVKVSFSADGGLTYPTVLLAATPNDGTEAITWPNVATTTGRIKVEAVDNYFYDINNAAITITPTAGTPTLATGGNATGATFNASSSDPLATTPTITAASSSVDGTAITGTAAGLPAGLALTRGASSADGTRPGTTSFSVTGTANVEPGSYPVSVTIGDAAAANQTVSFAIVVAADTATLTYSGDTAEQVGTVTASTTVADTDATPGVVTGTVVFTDQTTGDVLCSTPVASGSASCTFDASAARTYQVVGTLTSTRYEGASAAITLTVDDPGTPPIDTTPPQTTITAGPAQGSIQLTRNLTFRLASSEAGSTLRCSLNSTTIACGSGSIDLQSPAPGSYDVAVVATDAAGNADASPATRRFYVPVNDRSLKATTGPWRRLSSAAAYRGTYSTVARKGSTLTYRITRASSLALVLSNGPSFGGVDVFLGTRRLVTIQGRGAARTQRIAAITKFSVPTSGTLRIVTPTNRPVRIEGLAIRTSPATARMPGRPGVPIY